MNREDVEALLAACERDRIGPHPDNETLAALCRRWLEVEDARKWRYWANGPQGTFLTDDLELATAILAAYDKDDDWTVTDIVDPTGAAERLLQQEPTNQPQEGKSNA